MPATIAPGGKVRVLAVNANSGAFIIVRATIMTRRVEVTEDLSGGTTKQGLQLQIANDGSAAGFTNTIDVFPADEPFVLQEYIPTFMGGGSVIGNGPDASGGFTIPATQIFNVRSGTSTATAIRITEYV